ncbi:MAG: alkaline phosphatase [Rubrivivax sp.]|nr:alkaline phosphatase [Rubrivivax sp.]
MNRFLPSLALAALCGVASLAHADVTLHPLGRYQASSAAFASGAAEIVAYDKGTRRLFVVNAQDGTVDVLDATDPSNLVKVGQIDAKAAGASLGAANSVAVRNGLVAVAIEADPITAPGLIAFYDASSLELLRTVRAGALPDAVTFSNTGHFAIAVNEGEARDGVDPEGSITIVDLRERGRRQPAFSSCTADFRAFDAQREALVAAGVVIDPQAQSVAQDLEPEFAVAVGNNAYVTLQENNAIAVVQLEQCRVKRIVPLGFKDHGVAENALDTSDRDFDGGNGNGRILLRSWANLYGVYQPDAIAAYEAADGQTYLVIANEGDARDAQEARVGSLTLDPAAFPDPNTRSNANLGRLTVNRTLGCKVPLAASGSCAVYDRLFAYGARSFSILTNDGRMVFDSANDFERIIAGKVLAGELPAQAFNANHGSNSAGAIPGQTTHTFDTRSDDKGPEPEGVVVGRVGDRTYAFVGLERIGGVMIYDVTDPANAFYVDYVNHRNFAEPVCTTVNATGGCTSGVPNPAALDLGPEGLAFVSAEDSPNGRPLVIVGNEVSGSTTVFEVVPKR